MSPSSYLICSTVRSGSTLLSRTLGQLEGCGQPEEYFHRHTIRDKKLNQSSEAFRAYCHDIRHNSFETFGTFGMKMHWWQLSDFLAMARHSLDSQSAKQSDRAVLEQFFPGLKYVYLRREDVVAQAVSAAIASQTGQWEKQSPTQSEENGAADSRPIGAIKFHPWKIYEWKTLLEQQNQSWKTFFQDGEILPYSLTYESLVNNFLQEVSQVLQHICLTPKMNPNSLAMPVQRQANAANARLISAYNRLPTPVSASLLRLYRWRRPLNATVLPLPGQKGAKKKGGLA